MTADTDMTTTEHKIKSIGIYLIPSIVNNVLPLFTLPILTRFLSPKDFGIAALALGFVSMIFSFFGCNVDAGTQLYYFKYRKNSDALRSLVNSGLFFLIAISVISSVLVFIFARYVSLVIMGSPEYGFAVFIAYLGCCFTQLVSFYLKLFRNMEMASSLSFFTTLQSLLNAVFSLSLIVFFQAGYMGLLYASLFSSLVIFCALFYRFAKLFPFAFSFDKLKESFLYGIQLLPTLFTGSIYDLCDKYLLRRLVSFTSAGLFSIAQNFANKLFVFMTAVQSTFEPLFMKDMFDKGKAGADLVGRNFTLFAYISLSAFLVAVLFSEEIMYYLAPPSYYNAVNVMLVLLCATSIQAYGKLSGLPLAYAKKAYLVFPISVVGAVLNVVLNILLIPKFGAFGAAIATFFTIFVLNLINYFIGQRCYRINFDIKNLFAMYGTLFAAGVVLILLKHGRVSVFVTIPVKFLFLLLFYSIGKKTGIITRKNIGILIDIIKFKKKETVLAGETFDAHI